MVTQVLFEGSAGFYGGDMTYLWEFARSLFVFGRSSEKTIRPAAVEEDKNTVYFV